MLVLSRKKGEAVCIGEGVRVIVVDVKGDKIRLGIEAPGDVAVHRQEIFDAIKAGKLPGKQTEPAAR